MVVEDEYELLPHEEIQKLRNELDRLKKNPLGETPVAKDLYSAVADLTLAINGLTKLLTSTNDEMVKEFERTSITEQFSKISDQNAQIAQGILSVAQLVQQNQVSQPPVQPQVTSPVSNQQNIVNSQVPPADSISQPPPSILPSQDPLMASPNAVPPLENIPPASQPDLNQAPNNPPINNVGFSPDSNNASVGVLPPMVPPAPSMPSQSSGSLPPPGLDLPPAPAKKKGLMGLFK